VCYRFDFCSKHIVIPINLVHIVLLAESTGTDVVMLRMQGWVPGRHIVWNEEPQSRPLRRPVMQLDMNVSLTAHHPHISVLRNTNCCKLQTFPAVGSSCPVLIVASFPLTVTHNLGTSRPRHALIMRAEAFEGEDDA
jgi:hypothetical protein